MTTYESIISILSELAEEFASDISEELLPELDFSGDFMAFEIEGE